MIDETRLRQPRRTLALLFCLGIALTLVFAVAPLISFDTPRAAYADSPAIQHVTAKEGRSEAQSPSTQENGEASAAAETKKSADTDANSALPAAKKEFASLENSLLFQIIATVICVGLLAAFFFAVFRKTNRNISDMDNMFR